MQTWQYRMNRRCVPPFFFVHYPLVSLDTIRAGHLLAVAKVHFAAHRSAKNRSTTVAPNFSFRARSWFSSFLPANIVCHFLHHTGLHCSRSDWHRDRSFEWRSLAPRGITIARSEWHRVRSLRVASQSLAVVNFRRLHGSNPHDFSSLKLHLGMGEDFSAKQQSKLQKTLGADNLFFALDAKVNGKMTRGGPWGATDMYTRLTADRPKSGLLRNVPRRISSL